MGSGKTFVVSSLGSPFLRLNVVGAGKLFQAVDARWTPVVYFVLYFNVYV